MKPFRVLLVEHLDAMGAAPADARLRTALLRACGATVRVALLEPPREEDLEVDRGAPTRTPRLACDRAGLRALAAVIAEARPDLLLWACASEGGGTAARIVPHGQRAMWWPTGFGDPLAGAGPLAALGAAHEGDALAWCATEPLRAGRGQLPLWDGDYVLVPQPLAGLAGVRALEWYAEAAYDRAELDLVVLAQAQPEFERHAERLGIGLRMHFVGPAPRDAELAWVHGASVAMLAGDAAISGGFVLRALAGGCPLLAIGDGAPMRALARWLEQRGCALADSDADSAAALEQALERTAATERVRVAGRAAAATQVRERLVAPLEAALRIALSEREDRAA